MVEEKNAGTKRHSRQQRRHATAVYYLSFQHMSVVSRSAQLRAPRVMKCRGAMVQGAGEVEVGVKGVMDVQPADDASDVVVGKVLQVKAHAENVAWNEAAGFGACYREVHPCKINAHARAHPTREQH